MITTQTHIRLPAMNLRQLRGNRPRRMSPSWPVSTHQGGGPDGRTGPISVDSQNEGHRMTFATPRALAPTLAARAWTPMDALAQESQP